MRSWARRHQLAIFFVLAVVLSWWPWPMTRLNADSIAMIPWGPAVSALLVSLIATGTSGLADLLRSLTRWRVGPRWYLAALGIPLVTWALAASITSLFLGGQITAGLAWIDLPIFMVSLFTIGIVNGPLTEELAWRGFALPRMLDRFQPVRASLALGLAWFLWHLPLLATDPTRPVLPFAVSILSFSVILTWLYLGTGGSVLIAVLFHSGVNTAASAVVPMFPEGDRLAVWWLFVAMIVVVAVMVGRSHLLRSPSPHHVTLIRDTEVESGEVVVRKAPRPS